jgi:hypothetical protein
MSKATSLGRTHASRRPPCQLERFAWYGLWKRGFTLKLTQDGCLARNDAALLKRRELCGGRPALTAIAIHRSREPS